MSLNFLPFQNYHWPHFLQAFQQDRECISAGTVSGEGKLDVRLVRQAEPEWYRLTRNIWFESVKRQSMAGAEQVWQVFFPGCTLRILNLPPKLRKSKCRVYQKPFVFIPKGQCISRLGTTDFSLPFDSMVVHIFSGKRKSPSNPLLIYVQFDRRQPRVKREHYEALSAITAYRRSTDRAALTAPLLPFESSPEMLIEWGKMARATYMGNPKPDFLDMIHGKEVARRGVRPSAELKAIPNDDFTVTSIHSSADFLLIPGIPLAELAPDDFHGPDNPQPVLKFSEPTLVLKFPHASTLITAHEQSFHYHRQRQHTLSFTSQVQGTHLAYLLHFHYDYSSLNSAIEEMIATQPGKRIPPEAALPYTQGRVEWNTQSSRLSILVIPPTFMAKGTAYC